MRSNIFWTSLESTEVNFDTNKKRDSKLFRVNLKTYTLNRDVFKENGFFGRIK